MKKNQLLLSAVFLISLLAFVPARADELAVVVSGKPQEAVEIYRAHGTSYLNAKKVAALYGGQLYWYPVSGRLRLGLRGRSLQLLVGSTQASSGETDMKLLQPVIVRASQAFIPLSFLTDAEFARWSGYETRHDERTRTLIVERQGTVGAVRMFSYSGRSRVSVELAAGASYRAVARGTGGVDLVVDFGVAESEETSKPDDEVLFSYSLRQEPKLVRLSVRFAKNDQRWRVFEQNGPRRAVIEVYAPGVQPPEDVAADEKTGKAEITKPESSEAKPSNLGAPPPSLAPASVRPRRLIMIDPGHGGKDPGAIGRRGTHEKDVNLAVGLELARVLRERGDFDVMMTRESDVFVPLSDRPDLANSKKADLFISLHCNAADSKHKNGFEVYSISETASDPEAEKLAVAENAVLEYEGKNPQDEMAKMILLAMTKTEMINESAAFAALAAKKIGGRVDIASRGVKQAAFYVLRGTHAPAILVEMAFLSHPIDEAKLASRRFRRTMAEGLAASTADYARRQGWLQ
ncbi:MAG: N-acetylmuramoyl-L-alanine amidase [Elusimicrobiota bacterium]